MIFQVAIGNYFKLGDTGDPIGSAKGYGSIGEILSHLIPNILIAANIILFFLILLGGFTLITSSGNPEKQKQGSQTLTYSLVGFLLVFCAYWIMQIIGILTGFDWLNPGI